MKRYLIVYDLKSPMGHGIGDMEWHTAERPGDWDLNKLRKYIENAALTAVGAPPGLVVEHVVITNIINLTDL